MKPVAEATPSTLKPLAPFRFSLLRAVVDRVTRQEALEIIESFIHSRKPHQIITLNSEMALASEMDLELSEVFLTAALVIPDSAGILWASRKIGMTLPEKIPGIELAGDLTGLATQKGWRVYLLGGKAGVADQAAINLRREKLALTIVGTHHGYFEEKEETQLISHIRSLSPQILFVGMGVPKQEKWIKKNLFHLQIPVVMGIGGSLDVWAGRLKRAPKWICRSHLEWLYRLIQEPQRMRRALHLRHFAYSIYKQKKLDKKMKFRS